MDKFYTMEADFYIFHDFLKFQTNICAMDNILCLLLL